VSVAIAASQAAVWECITDIERAHERIPAIKRIEILSPQRHGLGLRWRETRVMFGKEATEVMEITQWRPPHEYVTSAQGHGSDYRCTLRVEPTASGSTLSFHFSATPLTLMAKIMGTLMAPLMRGAITKALQGDLNAIKASCESAPHRARVTRLDAEEALSPSSEGSSGRCSPRAAG
jgi:carbon monoxide dehydrogenase subunit G